MAHPNPRTQKLAMAMAREGLLTSTSLAYQAHLTLKAAATRIGYYTETMGLVESCGGRGVKHNPERFKLTEAGKAWLDGKPKLIAYDCTALVACWVEKV